MIREFQQKKQSLVCFFESFIHLRSHRRINEHQRPENKDKQLIINCTSS